MRQYIRRKDILTIPEHVHPVVRELWRLARKNKKTLREIARRAGVDYKSMDNWRKTSIPRLDNIDACLGALGYRLAVVPEHKSAGWRDDDAFTG